MADWDDTYQVATHHRVTVNTGTGTVDSYADTLSKGCFWFYTVDKGSGANMRTGFLSAVWDEVADSSPEASPDVHSDDIGTTLGVVSFSVDKSGNSVRLLATVTSDGWTIDVVRLLIGAS